ncbi:MAG TPA: hypothetical protein VLJ62_05360 [Burkholderiaceae bacterium]|nr:hypothetical protein [Burkholderiaceae bacterium]
MSNAHYTFLSWYRTGLATAINSTAPDMRGEIEVVLTAKFGAVEQAQPGQKVRLIGPGDIIGLDARSVVRTDPRPFTNDFEPNYLAAVEFFDEDLPWRYAPQKPDGERLMPWLALIALADGEYAVADQGEGFPRALTVRAELLPPASETWAWAHTALNAETANPADPRATAALLANNPAAGCARLLAARKLKPNTGYRAFLVPTFEAGRLAGLRGANPGPGPLAWSAAGALQLPIYFDWGFRTGLEGDFEQLVRRLQPMPASPLVGRRPMDVSRPLPAIATPPILNTHEPPQPLLDLEGALQVPKAQPSAWEPGSKAGFQPWLADFINIGEDWTLGAGNKLDATDPRLPPGTKLPIILPPSYGRWHANIDTLDPTSADARWLEQLNLDPRQRVAAAYGTLVVQKNQEDFAARAWAQYGELFKANRTRARAQFMAEMLTMAETKHLAPLAAPALLALTSATHARIVDASVAIGGPQRTLRATVSASALPPAALAPALRRLLRPGGVIAKRLGTRSGAPLTQLIANLATRAVELAPAWNAPEQRLSLTHQPAALGADRSLRLGDDFEALAPLIRRIIELLRQLALRHPVLGEIADFLEALLARGAKSPALSPQDMVPATIVAVPARPDWLPRFSGQRDAFVARPEDLAPAPEQRAYSSAAWNFRQAALNAAELMAIAIDVASPRAVLDVPKLATQVRGALRPALTVRERIATLFRVPDALKHAAYDPLERIMAHPRYDDASYQHLKRISQDHVVPNLASLTNNSITLLECNWRFIESFMVGLNHEMARELMWRGYPTDQRGTYFAQFWDLLGVPGAFDAQHRIKPVFNDIEPIHGWKLHRQLTPLGENRPEGRVITSNVVLVVRGDVFRRYPNTEVYALRAAANPKPRQKDAFETYTRHGAAETQATRKDPILSAQFEPDIQCFGFDLDPDEARGDAADPLHKPGWYFVLAQRFGEPRFGLDDPPDSFANAPLPTVSAINDLSWGHLVKRRADFDALGPLALGSMIAPKDLTIDSPGGKARWPRGDASVGAADLATILLQTPFRMYFHANDMLGKP